MNTTPIEHEPGTVVHEAIQFLRARPASLREARIEVLAAGLGRLKRTLAGQLQSGIASGALKCRQDSKGSLWSLGDRPSPHEAAPVAAESGARAVQVSALAVPSVFAYADARNAAPFSTALSTDGRLTVERYGRVVLELTDAERRQLVLTAQEGVTP